MSTPPEGKIIGGDTTMNRKIAKTQVLSAAMVAVGILASPAQAKTRYYLLDEPAYPSAYEWIETMPTTNVRTVEKTVTIEKPVVIEKSTRTIRYTRPRMRTTSMKMKHRTLAARPLAHRTHLVATQHRTHLVATRPYASTYAKSFTTTKIVEKPVRIERFVETPVTVEQPMQPMIIEKAVEVDRPVLLDNPVLVKVKKHHNHLLELNLL